MWKSIDALEIKTLIVFNLVVITPAVIAQMFHCTAEHAIPSGARSKYRN